MLATLGGAIAKLSGVEWIGYLSTTGVYGDRQGGWVSEEDAPDPGQATVQAAPRRRARLARLRRCAGHGGQHIPPCRDLRPRPERARPAPRRLGSADRQTRPGVLPGPRRRCRGGAAGLDRPDASRGGSTTSPTTNPPPSRRRSPSPPVCSGSRRLRRSPSRPRSSPHSRGASIPSAAGSGTTASSASSAWCCAIPPIARDLRSLAAP